VRDASIQAIKDTEAAISKTTSTAKDFEKAMSFYADDAFVFAPDAPVVTGRDAIRAAMKPGFEDPSFALTGQTTQVEADKSGELGYAQGAFSVTVTDPKTKKPVTDTGKYVTVYRKQADGSWKVVADIWNSDPRPSAKK
jgi:uncharacterized protein (TIGR02246 family)